MKQNNYLNFANHHIYVGIDVHYKKWVITILTEYVEHKTFTQDPHPEGLIKYLRRNFPGARYHCVYEAGFSGFWIYEKLKENGVDCIVINPADVPTTNKEKDRKTDRTDSRKLAKCLRNEELKAIYVHSKEQYEERTLIRTRDRFIKDQTRCKNRIKGLLKFYGIGIPDEKIKTHWSNKFIEYISNVDIITSGAKISLNKYIEQLRYHRKMISELTKEIRKLSTTQKYREDVYYLNSVPGISMLSSMIFLAEVGDPTRFGKIDRLLSFIGIIPSEHSSGEKENRYRMTNRGNSLLKKIIIESSWVAIRKDPGLMMTYNNLLKKKKGSRAIIVIARKLVGRIMYVLKNKTEYKYLAVN